MGSSHFSSGSERQEAADISLGTKKAGICSLDLPESHSLWLFHEVSVKAPVRPFYVTLRDDIMDTGIDFSS